MNLIERQKAIDAVLSIDKVELSDGDAVVRMSAVNHVLRELPSAQLEKVDTPTVDTPTVDTPTCEDAVSRQAVYNVLDKMPVYGFKNDGETIHVLISLSQVNSAIIDLPSVQPERTCVNCGRTMNNGGWYADGRTRCPIEEHYALPKDGYCHLWEKRNVTDDDYPEGRTDE